MAKLFENVELTENQINYLAKLPDIIHALILELKNPNSRLSLQRRQQKLDLLSYAIELLEEHYNI
jgi:hypothetical protein